MDFSWTEEQRRLQERMRSIGAEVAASPEEERLHLLAAAGVLGLPIDTQHGGGGYDCVTTAAAYEALGETLDDGGVLLAAGAHLFGVALTIQKVGDPYQRTRYLTDLASGKRIGTVAATEAEAGSHVGANQARLDPDDAGGFRASGDKRYVTWSDRADLFLYFGRQEGARGLTAALVERGPGVTSGPRWSTAGLANARLGPVRFTNAPVPRGAVLGRPGAGMAVFQAAMAYERAMVLAFRLGAMKRQLDDTIEFARKRRLGDTSIASHQAVSHRVARMRLRLETARLLTYRAAWTLDQRGRAAAEAALAKWHVAEAAVESALDACRVLGGRAFLDESGAMASLDDAIGGSIHSGTSDVLATIVARWEGMK